MSTRLKKIILLLVTLFIENLHANDRGLGYVGGSYSDIRYTDEALLYDVNVRVISFRTGFPINRYFALEVRTGAFESTEDRSIKLGAISGWYGKVTIPILQHSNIHGLVGFTGLFIGNPDFYKNKWVNSFSYIFGFDLNIHNQTDFVIEYVQLISTFTVNISAIEAGLNYKFK